MARDLSTSMIWSMGRWIALGAALTTLVQPPNILLVPTFVCLVPAVILIHQATLRDRWIRAAGLAGLAIGLVTSLITFHWIPIAAWRIDPRMLSLGIITVVVVGVTAAPLFIAACWLGRSTGYSQLWIFPPLWSLFTWLPQHLGPLSFHGLGLSPSLSGFPVLLQGADILGPTGIEWLIGSVNAAFAVAWIHRSDRRGLRIATVTILGLLLMTGYGVVRSRTLEMKSVGTVGVVQPNVGYRVKWRPSGQDAMFDSLLRASNDLAAKRADLIVWPELAIPDLLSNRPMWLGAIYQSVQSNGTPIALGALGQDTSKGAYHLYNSVFMLDPNRGAAPVYRKRHLVPFVEWRPGRRQRLPTDPFAAYTAGEPTTPFRVGRQRASATICFEAAFPKLLRADRRRGADWFLNLSNDAWVAGTGAPAQFTAQLTLRAIENRVGIVRVANTGPSLVIRPNGTITAKTPIGQSATMVGEVHTTTTHSLYTRLGDWAGALALSWLVLLVGRAKRARRRR